MSGREFILGMGLSVIDPTKGRAALPAQLRNAIIANNSLPGRTDDRTFFLGQHVNGKCLVGYDRDQMATLLQRIADVEDARGADAERVGFDHELRENQFARFEQVPLDPSGRFTLSKKLRRWGRLEDLVFVQGLGDVIEIWNPHHLLADPDVSESRKQDCRDEMEEKGLL
jgi:DNA-binding transcriptional regulator/RsmH inhibitor MraZ